MPSIEISWEEQPGPDEVAELSGLELLRASIAGELPAPPISRLMGMDLVEVEEGWCRFTTTPGPRHTNPVGVVHGGVLATLMDAVTGVAVQSHLPPAAGYSTTDLHVRYVRRVVPGEVVEATGRTLHVGRTMATAQGEARDQDGRLLGTGTASYFLHRP